MRLVTMHTFVRQLRPVGGDIHGQLHDLIQLLVAKAYACKAAIKVKRC